ncbi:MAG: tetratricopeptide repeat protein [Flavobacteriales bacterium]|nr:tetratricopeptide repeat protein [Flavobacteriales bacterium]
MKTHSTYLFLLLFCLVVSSCSTQKDRFLNRAFHRTTSKYNGYFNAKESFKGAVTKLEKSHQEDYNNILPTTILGDQKQAQKIYPALNRTIDKAALVVEYHSMEVKGKEKNKWIDDCYLLMGKALFYKQEYGKAIEMFGYVNREYSGEVADLAVLWSTRAHIEMGNFTTANKQLLYLESDAKLSKDDLALFEEIKANYHLKKENWPEVISQLKKAIKLTSKKSKRTRLIFIIGQIHQKLGEYESAFKAFDKVVRMNPDYELLFNALLSRARAFDPKHQEASTLIDEINKMLKDEKNKDYYDQIYFALADIYLKEGRKKEAIENLQNATLHDNGNDQQQSVVHLMLADLYFEDAYYISSQVHYDTAITFLNQNHPDYEVLLKKRNSLNELVELYNTISLQDSLYQLSSLDEVELKSLIENIIKEKKEEKHRAKEALKANARIRPTSNSRNSLSTITGGGWYFYNPSAVSFGYSEFMTKWGERRLEDDWRRKNKSQVFLDEDNENQDEEQDLLSEEYYMSLIPFSDSAKTATLNTIVESYYQLGLIYKEDLNDFSEALETFKTLLEAYPKNKYEALTYYQLYRLNMLVNDQLKADQYLNKLTTEYPKSDYLDMIVDPDQYYSDNKEDVDSAVLRYENIYIDFTNHQYVDVIQQSTELKSKYLGHPMMDQLALLNALSIGHLYGEDSLVSNLNQLLSLHQSGEVAEEARALLQDLESRSLIPDENKYTFDADEEHFYVLALETTGPSINEVKIVLSDFNREFYKTEGYKTQSLMLNMDYQLIIVKKFDAENPATRYLEAVKNSTQLKELILLSDYEHFIISSSNFKTFYNEKSLDKYMVYFEEKYLKYK